MAEPKLILSRGLFANPLLAFQLAEPEDLNRRLLADITDLRASSPGVERSNQQGWHSDDHFFLLPAASIQELRSQILQALAQATQSLLPTESVNHIRFKLEGWANVNGKGAYNSPHEHPGFVWSGTYYVSLPSDSRDPAGHIEFLDPRTNFFVGDARNAIFGSGKIGVRPEAGVLLIFPAFLRHWVHPNDSEDERVSIAFNANPVAAAGK